MRPLTSGLSVSSVGSWALQLVKEVRKVDRVIAFSILGRIVGTATNEISGRNDANKKLSVSSVGSWALQLLVLSKTCQPQPPTFSILGRIVGTATTVAEILAYVSSFSFSILGRIVGTATAVLQADANHQRSFQYPRSDRGHCNGLAGDWAAAWQPTFSILGRIVGTATVSGHFDA